MAARWDEDEEFDPPTTPVALDTLRDAQRAIVERGREYGNPLDNHTATAVMWRSYLHRRFGVVVDLDAEDICLLNILQKVSREANKRKADNRTDIVGFIGNIELVGRERARRDTELRGATTDTFRD